MVSKPLLLKMWRAISAIPTERFFPHLHTNTTKTSVSFLLLGAELFCLGAAITAPRG